MQHIIRVCAAERRGPVEAGLVAVPGPVLERYVFRAPAGAAPFTKRGGEAGFLLLPGSGYLLRARATRVEVLEMPSGRFTSHRRSASSTWSTIVAGPGGWSRAPSIKR